MRSAQSSRISDLSFLFRKTITLLRAGSLVFFQGNKGKERGPFRSAQGKQDARATRRDLRDSWRRRELNVALRFSAASVSASERHLLQHCQRDVYLLDVTCDGVYGGCSF